MGMAKYAKKTRYSKIFFSTFSHMGKKLHVYGKCIVRMSMKSSTNILTFMAPESGVQALEWGKFCHIVYMFENFFFTPIFIIDKT